MLSLVKNAGMMTTNLRAELPGYGTVWFDPQAMTNVLGLGNIAKQYLIQYLQESDTFEVQLSNHINIFGHKQVDNLYVLEGNPKKDPNKPLIPRKCFPSILKRMPSFSLPRRYSEPMWLISCYIHWVILQWSTSRPSSKQT